MQTPLDVRSVMLFTLDGIDEVRAKLVGLEALGPNAGESLALCIDILNSIWEVNYAHERTLTKIVKPLSA